MKSTITISGLILMSILFIQEAFAQELYQPLNIQKAFKNQTRSMDGNPGIYYWQNSSDYKIEATLDTKKNKLIGSSVITYYNNSPDTLGQIVLRLYNDFFKKGGARQWRINPDDLSNGVEISSIKIGDEVYDPENDFPYPSYATNFNLMLKEKIIPGSSTKIEISWSTDIPTKRGLRMRKYENGHYFIAYWYPQIAVYDDVDGWDAIEYFGMVEFYNDINNFDVKLTLPADYVIWATGELQNAKEVFQPEIVKRYEEAKKSDDVIKIITQEDYENNLVTKKAKSLTWHFIAKDVPDFSFAASTKSNWDGSSLIVDTETNRRVLTDVVYPEGSDHWKKGAEVSRASIEYMSFELPGYPFPYPHMTSFWSGTRGGGMETPMMANNGSPKKYADFVELLFHEISHTYFPFYMGTNERKYAWMDEGWAAFLPKDISEELSPEADYLKDIVNGYQYFAGQEAELPLMVPSYQHNNYSSARVAAYTRPAMAYHFLRDALGDEMFKKALLEYMNRWKGKHPLPYDFFNTFDNVSGQDLSWFWKPWFFESGYPDLGIKSVSDNNEVIVEKVGSIPVTVYLQYETERGKSSLTTLPTSIWSDGRNEVKVNLPPTLKITSITLGNHHIPDVNVDNNYWEK